MQKKYSLKAQFWSLDIVFAIVIFSVALTILAYTWLNVNTNLSLSYGNANFIMQTQAQIVARNILTPGYPSNWQSIVNTTNPSTWIGVSAGLSVSEGSTELSIAKIYSLQSMAAYNYTQSEEALGASYNYYIAIDTSAYNITIGKNPLQNGAVTIVTTDEGAFINGVPARVAVYIWSSSKTSVE